MNKQKKIPEYKTIAIVALPENRTELIEWAFDNKKILRDHVLVANGATAQWLEDTIHTNVEQLSCGTNGGFGELAQKIADNDVDMLIFFGNPADASEEYRGIKILTPVAIEKNIVMAFNAATANLLIGAGDHSLRHLQPTRRAMKPVMTIPTFLYSTGNWFRRIAAIA